MQLLFSELFFSNKLIQALSWTLIHSLWQGMLLSMIGGSIVYFTRRYSAALRYNLLTGALLSFIMTVVVTFNIQITNVQQLPANGALSAVYLTENASASATALMPQNSGSIFSQVNGFLNEYAGYIVIVWMLVIALKCIQLTAGLYSVFQLRRRQTFSPGEYWLSRVTALSHQLQINKKVQLLQSGLAKVPAVVGFFKPVILFPVGMLASLPPSEVEAILIHELAHVKRKDFLVNMLQHVIEIIFFFNPAVLWVSSLIKLERENCCDDIAVSNMESRRMYVNALVSFHDFDSQRTPAFSSAFGARKAHLTDRIKRIIYNSNKTLNAMEKKLLSAGLIVTCAIIFAFTSGETQKKVQIKNDMVQAAVRPMPEHILSSTQVVNDTLPVPEKSKKNILKGTIDSKVNGKRYLIITKDNAITSLQVDGKTIPGDKLEAYKNITDKILEESIKGEEERQLTESVKEVELNEREIEQTKVELEQSQKEAVELKQSKIAIEQAIEEIKESQKVIAVEMEKSRKEMHEDMENAKRQIEQSKNDMALSQKQRAKMNQDMQHHMNEIKGKMAQDITQSKIQMEKAQMQMGNAKKQMELAKIQMMQAKIDMEQSKKIQEQFVSDLVRENIIKDKSDLESYKLNNEELIVNGVKQSDAVHKKFKAKFVKSKDWNMQYNN